MPPRSMAPRALLAVALVFGFYLFGLAVAAALLLVPYAAWKILGHVDVLLLVLCLPAALVILWSILPRPDRFVPPGPRLSRDRHPRLFETLDGVAAAMRQAMPSEVYLLPSAEAWVARRGGLLGLGGRRVMGIGLPLLESLSVEQFRAVIAHEFGHFHGGDLTLGPWIHETRGAMARTVQNLGGHGSQMKVLFALYALVFLRITHAVSRQQERTADEAAARAVGSRPLIEALEVTRCVGPACEVYWDNWVRPVVERGFRPPMLEGCRRFLDSLPVGDAIAECLADELPRRDPSPYDTHPPLHERIAFLERLPEGPRPGQDPPALTLAEDSGELETELLRALIEVPESRDLVRVPWERVGREVWLPEQREIAEKHARALLGITPGMFPELARDPGVLRRKIEKRGLHPPKGGGPTESAAHVLGAALAAALDRQGWDLRFAVGEEIAFEHEGMRVRPLAVFPQLVVADLTPEAWQRTCEMSGIRDLDLGESAITANER